MISYPVHARYSGGVIDSNFVDASVTVTPKDFGLYSGGDLLAREPSIILGNGFASFIVTNPDLDDPLFYYLNTTFAFQPGYTYVLEARFSPNGALATLFVTSPNGSRERLFEDIRVMPVHVHFFEFRPIAIGNGGMYGGLSILAKPYNRGSSGNPSEEVNPQVFYIDSLTRKLKKSGSGSASYNAFIDVQVAVSTGNATMMEVRTPNMDVPSGSIYPTV